MLHINLPYKQLARLLIKLLQQTNQVILLPIMKANSSLLTEWFVDPDWVQ